MGDFTSKPNYAKTTSGVWHDKNRRFARQSRFVETEHIAPHYTAHGVELRLKRLPKSSGGSIIKAARVLGVSGDTLTCQDINDATIYQVAKPWRLRVTSFPLLGPNITATAQGVQNRILTGTINGVTVTENQEITPRYFETSESTGDEIPGDVLLIEKVPAEILNLIGDDNQPVVWTDRNDAGRAWAAKGVILG
jgi:hypothetical protein